MIIKDTPRNLEFLNGNPRDLTPMTREEAVLSGEVVEPLNVNEALISNVSGGGRPVEMIEVSVGMDDTSPIDSNIMVSGYEIITINRKLRPVPTIKRVFAGDSQVTIKVPKISTETSSGCILRIEFDGGKYNSVSGSGYSILKVDDTSLLVNIEPIADFPVSIIVKLSDSDK